MPPDPARTFVTGAMGTDRLIRRASWPWWAFGAWALLVCAVSIRPIHVANAGELRAAGAAFFTFFLAEDTVRTVLVRLAAFVPLGMLAHRAVRGQAVRRAFVRAVLLAACVAAVVEAAQLLLSARHARASDLALSILFGIAGATFGPRFGAAGIARGVAWSATAFVLAMTAIAHGGNRPTGWDPTYPLVIGNEATGDKPWIGSIRAVALYAPSFPEHVADFVARLDMRLDMKAEVAGLADDIVLEMRNLQGAFAFYDFVSGGDSIASRLGNNAPPLRIVPPARCNAATAGLRLAQPAVVRSDRGMGGLADAVARASAVAIEVEFQREGPGRTGPARIVSVSTDPHHRNVMLGEDRGHLVVRVRTPRGGENGARFEARTVWPVVANGASCHVLAVYSRARVRIFVDGTEYAVDQPPANFIVHVSGGEPMRLVWLALIALVIAAVTTGVLAPWDAWSARVRMWIRHGGLAAAVSLGVAVLTAHDVDYAFVAATAIVPGAIVLSFAAVAGVRRAVPGSSDASGRGSS